MAELDAPRLVVSSGAVSLNSAQIATDVNLAGARLAGNGQIAFTRRRRDHRNPAHLDQRERRG